MKPVLEFNIWVNLTDTVMHKAQRDWKTHSRVLLANMKSVFPGDSSCLTSVVTGSWCFIHTHPHTHTHTPFGYCLSLSSVPPHNGHTPNRIFSTENVFTGKRSFCPHTALQYCRCIIDVFFLFFSGLSLYCYNTTIIAPMGFSLTWFIFLHSKINSPSPVWKTLFLVSVKIASLPLLTTNLSSQVWQLAVRLSAVFRFPPAVPAHAYIRFHAKIMLHLFIFQFHFQLSVSCAEKGLLQWRGRRDGKAKQRLTTCAETSPPSHYSHQTSLNKIIICCLPHCTGQ